MSCYKWDSCKSDDSVVIRCLYLACWVIRTGVTSCQVNHENWITDGTANAGVWRSWAAVVLPLPSRAHHSWGSVPNPCSWHESSSSGRNISSKHYVGQTATRPQITAGHTPRFRAGSDRVSQHGLTQRTLYFILKQKKKPNYVVFQCNIPS